MLFGENVKGGGGVQKIENKCFYYMIIGKIRIYNNCDLDPSKWCSFRNNQNNADMFTQLIL